MTQSCSQFEWAGHTFALHKCWCGKVFKLVYCSPVITSRFSLLASRFASHFIFSHVVSFVLHFSFRFSLPFLILYFLLGFSLICILCYFFLNFSLWFFAALLHKLLLWFALTSYSFVVGAIITSFYLLLSATLYTLWQLVVYAYLMIIQLDQQLRQFVTWAHICWLIIIRFV